MPPKRLDALIAIGTLVAPHAKRAFELAQAWDAPDDYADEHAALLEVRGIDGAVDHLPWIALIEILGHAGALAELDGAADGRGVPPSGSAAEWRRGSIDAAALKKAVERLEDCPRGAFAWMKHDGELAERSAAELLELAGKALLAKELQLVQLTGDHLGTCLVVVAKAQAAELTKLVRAAGYGEATLFTGAKLAKATKDRAAAAKRATKLPARAARPAKELRYFARGKESWTVHPSETGFEACYEKPRVKFYVHHYFDDVSAARGGMKRQLVEWEAAGFHEVDQAAFDKLPHADAPYINWTAPFPAEASYVVEGKEIVRCTELRDETIVELAGTIGYNFGESQNVYHCKTAAAATKRYAQHVAADAHFPAITRAELVRRYK